MIVFSIFLSSPNDCATEREATHAVVARLNADPMISSFARIQVAAWDWGAGVPFDALTSPQTSVNEHVPTPENCDVFVGIFRFRFGSALSKLEFRKPDARPFLSGSEYEFHRAWNARRRGATMPDIFMYRLDSPHPPTGELDEQRQNVDGFFARPPFVDNNQVIGAYERFSDTEMFAEKLEKALRSVLAKRAPGTDKPLRTWMNEQSAALTANAGPRYTRDAHVSTDIVHVFNWLLARKEAVAKLDYTLKEIYENLPDSAEFRSGKNALEAFAGHLRTDPAWRTTPDFDSLKVGLRDIAQRALDERSKIEMRASTHAADEGKQTQQYQEYQLRKIHSESRAACQLVETFAPLVQRRVLLLVGPAGQGKTHTLVHEVNSTLHNNGIAVGVLGQTLSDRGPIWDAVRSRLAWEKSIDSLLDVLDNEAAQSGQRALIVIDALNEMPDRKRWRTELPAMIQQVTRRPHLALVLAVRTDYLKMVVPDIGPGKQAPWVLREHPGFNGIEPEGLAKYFSFYGIKVPSAPPLGEFGNPLYVQMLARSLQNHEFKHWQPSWLHVWETWISRLEADAIDQIGHEDASRPAPVRRTMYKLAEAMLKEPNFVLPRFQADSIARQASGLSNIIGFLCSAGALVDRVDGDDEEVVEFGFERLSDTFFADRLLTMVLGELDSPEKRRHALAAALGTDGALMPIGSRKYSEHPLYRRRAGLLSALCLAAPRLVGVELPTLLNRGDTSHHDTVLSNAFIDSLRWRSEHSDFGAQPDDLYALWLEHSSFVDEASQLDELIRFALIPGHPLGMDRLLHPRLLAEESIGARDAWWSVGLASLWPSDDSNLRQLINWSCMDELRNVQPDMALPAARLLAWSCAASQKQLREEAMHGLTRLLAACPCVLTEFLSDFLFVDDPYVVEASLVAIWGVVLQGGTSPEVVEAVRQVYTSQFSGDEPRWCHLTIRNYARHIVEAGKAAGIVGEIDVGKICPPYKSALPLDAVPDRQSLENVSASSGFRKIVFSSTEWDFYRYVIGSNSASLKVSGRPLEGSPEPERFLSKAQSNLPGRQHPAVFDISLAGRFVAWNTLSLGYTSERFDAFDTGYLTRSPNRTADEGRTERIGKKYQWIGWHTLLAFLTDNYALRADWDGDPSPFREPEFFRVRTYDPARWLHGATMHEGKVEANSWDIPTIGSWPLPEATSMQEWIHSETNDPKPADIIELVNGLPEAWSGIPWIRVAAEHTWKSTFAPGYWGVGCDFHADLWMQILPVLIQNSDFNKLLKRIDARAASSLPSDGRLDFNSEWDVPLAKWPELETDWDCGFSTPDTYSSQGRLPVPFRVFAAECGHPDNEGEQAQLIVPAPSLFREWGLNLELRKSLVKNGKDVAFGLTTALQVKDVLFANVDALRTLLQNSGYRLFWFIRGERRAFEKIEMGGHNGEMVWADYHGLAYLAIDGRVEVAELKKIIRKAGE